MRKRNAANVGDNKNEIIMKEGEKKETQRAGLVVRWHPQVLRKVVNVLEASLLAAAKCLCFVVLSGQLAGIVLVYFRAASLLVTWHGHWGDVS